VAQNLLRPKPVEVDDLLAVVVEFGDGTAERIVRAGPK